jgi:hypothetical protein
MGWDGILSIAIPTQLQAMSGTQNYQCTCFYKELGLNDFDAGKSITRDIGRVEP